MSSVLSKIIAALLAVLLLYFVPAVQFAQREENTEQLTAYSSVTEFVDAVRNKGFISPSMYESFMQEIERGGRVYTVTMEHQHKKYQPEYADSADPLTFKGSYTIQYDNREIKDILSTLYPEGLDNREGDLRTYKLQSGDYFKVSIQVLGKSSMNILTGYIYGIIEDNSRVLLYGGMVQNEDY
ncbi:hypothetical protein J2Z69_000822 [Paenibacillus shirakamiensis]|uniref:DUF4251 domain-containing protein n=1 Tax=Paenibacillus shirakamiensis TaxID=1265935 RepID=A0ABS4JDL2_9BACL|nr:hypothetical protein [Paenibacillus shirakamiensis]MBP1999803.1 hypothetical protein [Paenibacillus shirakamiensis]